MRINFHEKIKIYEIQNKINIFAIINIDDPVNQI